MIWQAAFHTVLHRFFSSVSYNVRKVFSFLPTLPIGMALPLYLPKGKFLLRTPERWKLSLGSCLRFQHYADPTVMDAEGRRLKETKRSKKQVTFADQKGLSLTMVKVFSEFDDPIYNLASGQLMLRSAPSVGAVDDKLILDFHQPSSDYVFFYQRLDRNNVCLERCVLGDRAVTGTVKVKNVTFEKSVRLRVTFDTWKSFRDVDCTHTETIYPSCASDTFSFEMSVPDELQPHHCVEFAVCYRVDGSEYWDNNNGDNYRIIRSSMKRSQPSTLSCYSFDMGIHFDPYGSPTCSHGIFPDWPSYARYENNSPYY